MIRYIDRRTGEICTEKVYGKGFISLLYGESLFSRIFSFLFLPLLAELPFFSNFYGHLMKRPSSRKKIEPFVQEYGIDASEFEQSDFASFNDFFVRKLKPERRPIDEDPDALAAPADGRYLFYQTFDSFGVKGKEFTLGQFLQNEAYGNRYQEGSMAIARLCPTDYHRFHFPCDGTPAEPKLINGPLFSVNPVALKKRMGILMENKRVATEIDTVKFGTVLYVEVGATAVGSIRQTYTPLEPVSKGQEKGYFEFGGSCVVMLFEKGAIQFDSDLLENTKNGYETLCRFGERLGNN